jgi:hypothetical protein
MMRYLDLLANLSSTMVNFKSAGCSRSGTRKQQEGPDPLLPYQQYLYIDLKRFNTYCHEILVNKIG